MLVDWVACSPSCVNDSGYVLFSDCWWGWCQSMCLPWLNSCRIQVNNNTAFQGRWELQVECSRLTWQWVEKILSARLVRLFSAALSAFHEWESWRQLWETWVVKEKGESRMQARLSAWRYQAANPDDSIDPSPSLHSNRHPWMLCQIG